MTGHIIIIILRHDSLLKTIIEADVEGQVGRGNLQEWTNTHIMIL